MNWSKLIDDLRQRMTLEAIAEAVGCKANTLSTLGRSARHAGPRWETGQALIALHRKMRRRL